MNLYKPKAENLNFYCRNCPIIQSIDGVFFCNEEYECDGREESDNNRFTAECMEAFMQERIKNGYKLRG